jgi:ATP-binding cassette, subfamily B, bacterial MsbA
MQIGPAILGGSGRSAALLIGRLVRGFMRPHLRRIVLVLSLMGLAAASTAGRAWLMQPVLDRIFVAREGALLLLIAGGALALALVKGVADYGSSVLMIRVGQRVIADVQIALFSRLMRADLAYFHAHPSGTLIARFTSDAALLRGAAANVIAGIGKEALTVVFLVGVMFCQDWVLALVSFFVFPVAIRPIVKIGRRIRSVTINTQAEIGQFTTLLNQTFQGARHVKAYGMEEYEERRAKRLIERLFVLIDRGTRTRSRASPMMETLGGLAVAIVILYGGHQVISGARSPGALFSFITALLLAYQPLKSLANLNASLQEGVAAADRLFEVLDVEPTIRDLPRARRLNITGGEIRFNNVSFGYAPGSLAIEGISLTIPAGRTVALVGPSGAGKSTILNLIPRFFDVEAGNIMIDGQEVRSVTIASLRSAIALVAQEVSLFDDTVRANIAYGRFGASSAEIEEAARAAAADDFIRELPQGYDTVVGEHGIRLSGGQRQRIAIARAMVKNAPILLLDEATSALDSESERQVQRALNSLMRGRTTLVIAHRLSTVHNADLICVLDRGHIVETGRHAELLARSGLYARLHAMQLTDHRDSVAARADV